MTSYFWCCSLMVIGSVNGGLSDSNGEMSPSSESSETETETDEASKSLVIFAPKIISVTEAMLNMMNKTLEEEDERLLLMGKVRDEEEDEEEEGASAGSLDQEQLKKLAFEPIQSSLTSSGQIMSGPRSVPFAYFSSISGKKPSSSPSYSKIQSLQTKQLSESSPNPPNRLKKNMTEEQARQNAIALSKNVSSILYKILTGYDSNQRPEHGMKGIPSVIKTNIHIRSMGPMSELDMEYSLDCYFRQKWRDQRLQFEGPFESLSLNVNMLGEIWKPDTYFHNGKGSYLHTITRPNKFLRIYKSGDVYYSMRLTIKARCPMQLHNFPMDKQSCPLIFGSYGYTSNQLVYEWDSGNPVEAYNGELILSQFDLINFPYRNGSVRFNRGHYSMLQVNFNLRRHTGYFLIQVYLPCALIVVLSWVSFWLNREATADRVGLGITAVLTLYTFGMDTKHDLPKVSYPTALDWFVCMCFFFVVSTILEFAGVHFFTKVGSGEVPVIEIDEDWADEVDEENENPLHIIAPPKGFNHNGNDDEKESKTCQYYKATPGQSDMRLQVIPRVEEEVISVSSNDGSPSYPSNYCPKHNRYFDERLPVPKEFLTESEQLAMAASMILEEDEDDDYTDYDTDDGGNFEPAPRIQEPEKSFEKPWSRWPSAMDLLTSVQRCCGQFYYCVVENEENKEKMRRRRIRGRGIVNSVLMIDKVSRVLFPGSFVLLNVFYWLAYLNERNSPLFAWEDGEPM